MEYNTPDTPSPNSRYRSPSTVTCALSPSLLSRVTGIPYQNRIKFSELQVLDLHLREKDKGEIERIENLEVCPNLKLLNLSYNSIKVSCLYLLFANSCVLSLVLFSS